jgi:hypothetical protein
MDVTATERQLLEMLADAGQPTEIGAEDLTLGRSLEHRGLILFVRNSAFAVILPRGRHALSGEPSPTPGKKPLGYLG